MAIHIYKRVSFYKNKSITDSMIMNCVGVVTYTYLCRKYPNYFSFFKECEEVSNQEIGNLPSEINLYISDDPYKIKSDLIYYLCEENNNSNNILLCNSTCKPNYPLIEENNSLFSWIFICILMIILIFIAILAIYYLDSQSLIK